MIDDDRLIIPDGKVTGCLPRASRPGEVCAFLRDRVPIVPQSEWADWIGQTTLSQNVTQVLDQDGVGSCATESTTQAVMVKRKFAGLPFVLLNPWFIYHTTSGGSDRGSSIDANLQFVQRNGVAPESVWPRSRGWRTRPSEEAYAAAQGFKIEEFFDCTTVLEVGSALLRGFPVVFGWQGHSVLMVDLVTLRDGDYMNSWGARWGRNGLGRLPLASIDFRYGAFAVRVATVS